MDVKATIPQVTCI